MLLVMFNMVCFTCNQSIGKVQEVVNVSAIQTFDTADINELLSFSDNVFLGRVKKELGVKAIDSSVETQYSVEVLNNIKGSLQGTIVLDSMGGMMNGIKYTMNNNEKLEAKSCYIFYTKYNSEYNWYTAVPNHGEVKVQNNKETDKQVNELKAIAKNLEVQSNRKSDEVKTSYSSLDTTQNDINIPSIAVIFQHSYLNYDRTGYKRNLGVGRYTLADLNAAGIDNDSISSMYISEDLYIKAFQDDNFQGDCITLTSETRRKEDLARLPCYSGGNWNDKISSMVIDYKTDVTFNNSAAIVYEHADFSGRSLELRPAIYTVDYLTYFGFTDCISSIKLAPGYAITLYDDDWFTGKSVMLNSEVNDLSDVKAGGLDNWNDKTKFIEIKCFESVALYQHRGYDGYFKALPPGVYELSDLERMGVRNNDITGIRLAPGYNIAIYDGDKWTGDKKIISTDEYDLSNYGWNDRITSIEIYDNVKRRLGFDSISLGSIVYKDSTKYDTELNNAINLWRGVTSTEFKIDKWYLNCDVEINDGYRSDVSWAGLYSHKTGTDIITMNTYYLDNSIYGNAFRNQVMAHEFGHALGLADFYPDPDYTRYIMGFASNDCIGFVSDAEKQDL